jgi:amino acid transporter
MRATATPSLLREIGRFSLTLLVINSVIGSGIFGLPSAVIALLGAWSPVAVLIAGLLVFIVVLCFAEVGSRFDDAGGPYLYIREAFGPALGFQVGWMLVWIRILAGSASLNLLVAYAGTIAPGVLTPLGRALTITAATVIVTAINIAGVRNAAWTVNVFTVAKLLPLALLVGLGAFHINKNVIATQAVSAPNWTEAVLLLVFAYGGFESAVIPGSETRNPKRDTAFALIMAMAAVMVIYLFVQFTVVGTLSHAAQSSTPIASALGQIMGPAGSVIGSLGVVVSVYGWLMGFAMLTPRILYSMAQRGELPAVVGSVHPKFRTPHTAIVLNSIAGLAFALFSSFAQAATLAAIARLGIFALVGAALIVFRSKNAEAPGFRVPYGRLVAAAGIVFSVWLIATRSFAQLWILVVIVGAGALLWILRSSPNKVASSPA